MGSDSGFLRLKKIPGWATLWTMPKRSSTKRPRDANQLAKAIVDLTTGEAEEKPVHEGKAKAGRKGGRARASSLSDEQRSKIAKQAAAARWKKQS